MFGEAIISFRQFCLASKTLPVDLHIKLCDIARDSGMLFKFSFYNFLFINHPKIYYKIS